MENVYFKLYVKAILALTRTLVVKCEAIAETLNNQLQGIGYPVNMDDPTTWKYYLNLAGEYHPTDVPMRVRSMDTLEEIVFNRTNLITHRATAREYRPGTRFYADLTAQYPDQVPLINGIIAPISIERAIAAQDGELLYYDATQIENNETQLIPQLQLWLYGFFNRWYNRQYLLTDDLYLPAFLGILYQQLPLRVHLLRLAAARTPQVHSFHIREYLASNGRLDEFIPFLTREQQLYLYRNLRFLQRNVGKQEIFDRLVGKLLTARGLPLTWYKLQHNVAKLPEAVRPEVELVKYPLNFGYNQTGVNTEQVHTILGREVGVARDNASVQYDTEADIHERMSSSEFSSLPTKVLESEVVDRSNSSIRSLEHVLLNHWLYLATHLRYRAFVNVPNPGSGEFMSMSVKDAFIVAMYAFAKARDIELVMIPQAIAYDVLRAPLPTYDELASIVDPRYVPRGMIQAIMDRVTPLSEYTAIETFHGACAELHREYLKLWELYSFQENYVTRGLCEQLVRRHFMHIKCPLVDTPVSFDQWLNENGYGIGDLSQADAEQLYLDCVRVATGANLVNKLTLSEIQRAMLKLMGQLSSYSVHYLRNINQSDFRYVGLVMPRLGDTGSELHARLRFSGSQIPNASIKTRHRQQYDLMNEAVFPPLTLDLHTNTHYPIDPRIGMRLEHDSMGRIALNTASVGILGYRFTVDNPNPTDDHLDQYTL